MKIERIIYGILLLPVVLIVGVIFAIYALLWRYIAVWQLSDKFKEEHKEYHLEGEFNHLQFVLSGGKETDKIRVGMFKKQTYTIAN